MAEELTRWAPRLALELGKIEEATTSALSATARLALRATRRRAPWGTGRLSRGVHATATATGMRLVNRERYASLQDTGGTIRSAKLLRVPIGPNPSGGAMFVLKARDGRLFLATKTAGEILLQYRLMRSVDIKPTYFMREGFEEATAAFSKTAIKAIDRRLGV